MSDSDELKKTLVDTGEKAKVVIDNVVSDTTKELDIEGYKFTVDTDLLDDVEAFEHIDRIENKGQVAAIVPLLQFLIGKDGYEEMKAHFVKSEGRFKVTKLTKVYQVIIENFDPKD